MNECHNGTLSRDVVEHDEAASKQEAVGVCSQPHPPTAKQANIWITFSANGLKKPSIDHKNLKKRKRQRLIFRVKLMVKPE